MAEDQRPAPATATATENPSRCTTALLDKSREVDDACHETFKREGIRAKLSDAGKRPKDPKSPAGGYDDTGISQQSPGWTVKITFHCAKDLPMADITTCSSDPFIYAQLNTKLPTRHREDPHVRCRTPTVRRSTDPEWNYEWVIANIPSSGFTLKARIYDEDPADHDDRLGNVHVHVQSVSMTWPGIKYQPYKLKKRMGSKRAYLSRALAVCLGQAKNMDGYLYVSAEVLERTQAKEGGRVFTIGPNYWIRHYSPLLGRMLGNKEPCGDDKPSDGEKSKGKTERYNFQANQFQLTGPVPTPLYHRYVEFKPFIKSMFTANGLRGWLLSKALHHQHARVYNFDKATEWGYITHPSQDMARQFLSLVHYDDGGRIFTYVLTLDAQFRFTETGKEFGIDMLSKHTMHSDVSTYIAFSGEFFVRRRKRPRRRKVSAVSTDRHKESLRGQDSEDTIVADSSMSNNESQPASLDLSTKGSPSDRDVSNYELFIDNDSGTYRPNALLLPLLHTFLSSNLPGLRITTLDCQADAERMGRLKDEQRERKKKESGGGLIFTQQDSPRSSISSSEEEELDRRAGADDESGRTGIFKGLSRQGKQKTDAKFEHLKQLGHLPGRGLDGISEGHAERSELEKA